jgi:hypothetical protein
MRLVIKLEEYYREKSEQVKTSFVRYSFAECGNCRMWYWLHRISVLLREKNSEHKGDTNKNGCYDRFGEVWSCFAYLGRIRCRKWKLHQNTNWVHRTVLNASDREKYGKQGRYNKNEIFVRFCGVRTCFSHLISFVPTLVSRANAVHLKASSWDRKRAVRQVGELEMTVDT